MKKEDLLEFLEDIVQDCYIDSDPKSMLSSFQQTIQSLEKVKTKVRLKLDELED